MKTLLILFALVLHAEYCFSQSSLLPYFGVASTNLKGRNTELLPGDLIINSANETSQGILVGLTFLHSLSTKSSLGVSVQSNSFKTSAFVSRVQDPPEGIRFREIKIAPIYELEVIDDRLYFQAGPNISMLTGHKEIYVSANGEESETRIVGRDNFVFGLHSGLRLSYKSTWLGADVSVPLAFQDGDRYNGYLQKYLSYSIRVGYHFQFN